MRGEGSSFGSLPCLINWAAAISTRRAVITGRVRGPAPPRRVLQLQFRGGSDLAQSKGPGSSRLQGASLGGCGVGGGGHAGPCMAAGAGGASAGRALASRALPPPGVLLTGTDANMGTHGEPWLPTPQGCWVRASSSPRQALPGPCAGRSLGPSASPVLAPCSGAGWTAWWLGQPPPSPVRTQVPSTAPNLLLGTQGHCLSPSQADLPQASWTQPHPHPAL